MKPESTIGKLKSSRQCSFIIITLIYLAATLLGIWVFAALNDNHFLLRLFAADFAATVFVWLWGVYVMYLTVGAGCPSWNVILLPAIGTLANTCLFVFISIPMMEKRQIANKPGYAAYRKNVRMLI